MTSSTARALHHGWPGIVSARGPKPKSRFRLDWWSLLDPYGWWPVPHTVDEVFQAIAFLMELSYPARNATYTPAGLLRGSGAVRVDVESTYISDGWPVRDPVGEARKRLSWLALSSSSIGPEIIAWRELIGISYDGKTRALTCARPWIMKPAWSVACDTPLSIDETGKRLERLLTCAGRGRLIQQHNECHSRADYPMSVQMSLSRRWAPRDTPHEEAHAVYKAMEAEEKRRKRYALGWRFALNYGYPPPDGSIWSIPLVMQEADETFIDVMLRAEAKLAELTAEDPSRGVDPGDATRKHLAMLERTARAYGAPADAIRRGVRWYVVGEVRHLEVGRLPEGGPEWACFWDRHGGRGLFTPLTERDDENALFRGLITRPPDRRTDYRTGATLDHEGKAVVL